MQTRLDRLNLVLRENLTGIRVIRAFNREKQEQVRLKKANKDLTDVSIKVNKIMAIFNACHDACYELNRCGDHLVWWNSH